MGTGVVLVLLPVALAIVMLGLGLGLTVADFARVVAYPRAMLLALACQMFVLPIVCLGLVVLAGLPPVLAVGMMLLAASPGGTAANLYSHLFGGDVALNVTLTAINSVLAVVTLPLIVNASLAYFVGDATAIGLQYDKVVQVFAIVLVPVAIGMLVRRSAPGFAERMHKPVRVASVLVLASVTVAAIVGQWRLLSEHLGVVTGVAVAFSVASLTVGYWVPRLGGVQRPQAIATSMEIGIHNGTLAITIAMSVLGSQEMAIPAAMYSIVMFFTAAAAGSLVRARAPRVSASRSR